MSIRAISLGLLLMLMLSSLTYFNDHVVRQTLLIGNFLPISVFGLMILLVLLGTPLLRVLGPHMPLRPAEVALITAMALAACAWPGANLLRYFATLTTLGAHWHKTQPAWQAHHLMGYVPGGPGELAQGQVRNWTELAARVTAAADLDHADADAATATDVAAGQLWRLADPEERRLWGEVARQGSTTTLQRRRLATQVNRLLRSEAFFEPRLAQVAAERSGLVRELLDQDAAVGLDAHDRQRLHRAMLAAAMDDLIVLPRDGRGAWVAGAHPNSLALQRIVAGEPDDPSLLGLHLVPWAQWWPTIRLWCGAVLLLGLATLCLALIVHPQWSLRERLQYPIARFIEEVSRREHGAWMPTVARHRLFWVGFACLFLLHLNNGWYTWAPGWIEIPLRLEFNPLRQLFPTASRVPTSNTYFEPRLYMTVVAFAFFLQSSVSLSLGVAQVLFIMLGVVMISQGVPVQYDKFAPNPTNALRLGSYLAVVLVVLYTGRRYYLNVAASALGLARLQETPTYATWAARAFVPLVLAAWWLLHHGGLDASLGLALIAVCFIIWIALARVVAETGVFLNSGPFMPAAVILGLMGFDAIGPTGLLMLGLAGLILAIDPKEALMPFLANGLQMLQRGGVRIGRSAAVLTLVLVASLILATVVTLGVQHRLGTNRFDDYAWRRTPAEPFHQTRAAVADADATGTLHAAVSRQGWQRLAAIAPVDGQIPWLLFGFAAVIACTAARLRLPWWPLHPVIFIVWGTWAIAQFGFSFLLGWAVRAAVVRTTGERGYHATIPLMVGIIAGELTGGLLWITVGQLYYLVTGLPPERYAIFP